MGNWIIGILVGYK